MEKLLQALPKQLLISLLVAVAVIFAVGYGLHSYAGYLQKDTQRLKTQQQGLLSEISTSLSQNPYKSLVHFIALKKIITSRESVVGVMQRLSQVLPQDMRISQFSYDNEKNIFLLSGTVSSLDTYTQIAKYLNGVSEIKNLDTSYTITDKGVVFEASGTFQ